MVMANIFGGFEMPRFRPLLIALSLLATIAVCLSCQAPKGVTWHKVSNTHQTNIELDVGKNIPIKSYAEQSGTEYRITVIIRNSDISEIKEVGLKSDPYTVTLREGDNQHIITWDFSKERWKDRRPFDLRVSLDDEGKDYIDITAKHQIQSTPLRILVQIGVFAAAAVWYAVWHFALILPY